MHVVAVDFTIKPEHIEQFRTRVRQQARDSLAFEPECHVFDVCIDPAVPDGVFLYEIYEDAAAFGAHLKTAHYAEFDAQIADWVADKQVRQLEKLKPQ